VESPDTSLGADARKTPVPDNEYRALTAGAAFRVLDDRVVIRVTGDDRVSFLHGMCTNDVRNLHAGSLLYAMFLTEHAHVIADLYLWATAEALLIEADRLLWKRAREHLEKLLVADDVELEESADTGVIDLEGPRAAEVARALIGGEVPALWRFVGEPDLMVANIPRIGMPAFTILTSKANLAGTIGRLGPAVEVGAAALDTLRIENGIAKVGFDTGDKTIALEARLDSAISFNKGCYLGQETIERATARGGLKKRLFGLRFEGTRVPPVGAAAYLDGKEVGHVSSAAISPRLGGLGLGILHHSAWTPGTRVEIKAPALELKATVSELPFK
jgi:aminomethyltransferase